MEGWVSNPDARYDKCGTGDMGAFLLEMDLQGANRVASAFPPHPTTIQGMHVCHKDAECGSQQATATLHQQTRTAATSTLTTWA